MNIQYEKLKGKTIFVSKAAGFIDANLILELLKVVDNVNIFGIDSMSNYYDVSIKEYRLDLIE